MFCNLAARGVATYNGTLLLLRCYGVRTMFVSCLFLFLVVAVVAAVVLFVIAVVVAQIGSAHVCSPEAPEINISEVTKWRRMRRFEAILGASTVYIRCCASAAGEDNGAHGITRHRYDFIRIRIKVMNQPRDVDISFLFHPRNYYKLSLCVTFSNTFDNLWKSWRAYAQWRMPNNKIISGWLWALRIQSRRVEYRKHRVCVW